LNNAEQIENEVSNMTDMHFNITSSF
jgi:hypothetical protein